MRFLLLVILAIALSGCKSKTGPILAGGRPVDQWVRALSNPNSKLRQKAAEKLGNVGATDPAVVPALCEALNDKDAAVRCAVILARRSPGPAPRRLLTL